MLKNATYDLIETASVLSKGLYRYDQFQTDAEGCPQCRQLWTMMKQRDEEELHRILTHLKHHLDKETRITTAA